MKQTIKPNILSDWAIYLKKHIAPSAIYTSMVAPIVRSSNLFCPFCRTMALQLNSNIFTCHNPDCDKTSFDIISFYCDLNGLDRKNKHDFKQALTNISNDFQLDGVEEYIINATKFSLLQCYQIQFLNQMNVIEEQHKASSSNDSCEIREIGVRFGFFNEKEFYKLLKYPVSSTDDRRGLGKDRFILLSTQLYLNNRVLFDRLAKEYPKYKKMGTDRFNDLTKLQKHKNVLLVSQIAKKQSCSTTVH